MGETVSSVAVGRGGVDANTGCVVEILIAGASGLDMAPTNEVRAVPGKGLQGDRYFRGIGTFSPTPQKPDFELTLIELENVQAFAAQTGLQFTPSQARRNIVTSGVRLNDLVDRDFYIGEVRIRGLRLCEPCNHLAKQSLPEVLRGLLHKGGLRAQILSEGLIRVGDVIRT
jgi:MOSC domain-containing protein YiiM